MRGPGWWVNGRTPISRDSIAVRANRHCIGTSAGLTSRSAVKFFLVQSGTGPSSVGTRPARARLRETPRVEIATTDYHTAGEPFRIVRDGVLDIPGATVRDRRAYATESAEVECVRRMLCHEPRGHADMYGGFLVPADDDGADFGVLFWHKDGYSTVCGHGTIALGAWAVESGRVGAPDDGEVDVTIDVPSGRVVATVRR